MHYKYFYNIFKLHHQHGGNDVINKLNLIIQDIKELQNNKIIALNNDYNNIIKTINNAYETDGIVEYVQINDMSKNFGNIHNLNGIQKSLIKIDEQLIQYINKYDANFKRNYEKQDIKYKSENTTTEHFIVPDIDIETNIFYAKSGGTNNTKHIHVINDYGEFVSIYTKCISNVKLLNTYMKRYEEYIKYISKMKQPIKEYLCVSDIHEISKKTQKCENDDVKQECLKVLDFIDKNTEDKNAVIDIYNCTNDIYISLCVVNVVLSQIM